MTETLSKDLAGLVERWDASKFELDWHEAYIAKNKAASIKPLRYDAKRDWMKAIYQAGAEAALLAQHAVAEPQVPWLYAIQETNAAGVTSWHDGEQCVFGDRASAEDEVDCLNDSWGEGHVRLFEIVPLYRAPAHAVAEPQDGFLRKVTALATKLLAIPGPEWQYEEIKRMAQEVMAHVPAHAAEQPPPNILLAAAKRALSVLAGSGLANELRKAITEAEATHKACHKMITPETSCILSKGHKGECTGLILPPAPPSGEETK